MNPASNATSLDQDLYAQVQHFYARQMRLLDEGSVDEWAATFTADGTFEANAHPAPTKGREALAAAARATCVKLAAGGVIRRHWIGMIAVDELSGDSLRVTSYATVLETVIGGATQLLMSTTCTDEIARAGDRLLVRHRRVERDDLAPSLAPGDPRDLVATVAGDAADG